MAGNKNRGGGGMVYHWRHGWIPRTPTAALQKAHGSKKGASKLMDKHGIDGDLPGGKGKADASVAKSHPIGATVEARQPGIDNVTHGKVVGHTDSGMVRVEHTGHGGKPLVGTFNPTHTQVVKPGDNASAPKPHRDPHTLKPGEHATVRGIDHMGQPATFTGKVMANGEVSSFSKGRTTGGQPLRSIAIERQDGSKRQNVVYVPDPNRGEQKRGAAATNAAHAKVRDLPAGDTFKGVHSETHKGEKLSVRKGEQWGELEVQINGQTAGVVHGTKNSDAVKQLDSLRGTVDHAKANPGNYTNGFGEATYGMKLDKPKAAAPSTPAKPKYSAAEIARGYDMSGKPIPKAGAAPAPATKRVEIEHSGDGTTLSIDRGDTEARDAVKAAGFRWSSNLGAWYLPRTQHESTRRAKIAQLQAKLGGDSVNVDDGGRGATTTAAEREAERVSRAANRADRMDSRAAKLTAESERRRAASNAITDQIPMGQPILLGHHSQRRHERALERAHNNDRASWEAAKEARNAEAAAERARATAAGTDPLARQRRVDRNSAELRSVEKKLADDDVLRKMSPESQAKLARVSGVFKPLDSDYRARLEASRDRLRDEVAHDKSQIAASGIKQVTAKDVTSGDLVTYRNRTYIVTKVNKTTVSVPSGYSWDDKIPLNQVTKHVPLSTQSDSAIRTAFDRASDAKVKSVLRAELLRRGLSAA